MTDRELLELASKAAGIPVEFQDEFGDSGVNGWYPCGRDEGGNVLSWWNPLEDDGDALRLAVKLGIDICINIEELDVWADDCREPVISDAEAATRRAIVCAAASIGKDMS